MEEKHIGKRISKDISDSELLLCSYIEGSSGYNSSIYLSKNGIFHVIDNTNRHFDNMYIGRVKITEKQLVREIFKIHFEGKSPYSFNFNSYYDLILRHVSNSSVGTSEVVEKAICSISRRMIESTENDLFQNKIAIESIIFSEKNSLVN